MAIKMETKNIVKILAIVVSVVGFMVMVGWFLNIELLKRILPIWVTMKFSTALSFSLSGLILYFVTKSQEGDSEIANLALPIAGLVTILIMSALLVSVILGMRTGIEDLFVKEAEGAIKSTTPGRPSIGTMINFLLISGIAIITPYNISDLKKYLLRLGWIIEVIGLVAIIGYIINVPFLYYTVENISTAMAFHTAVLFSMMGLGFMLLGKNSITQAVIDKGEKNE